MSHEPEHTDFELAPELVLVRQQLALFKPTAPNIDRDQLMFNAGRASALASRAADTAPQHWSATDSARRPSRFWPVAATLATAAALLLAAMLLEHNTPVPTAPPPSTPPVTNIAEASLPRDDLVSFRIISFRPTSGYLATRNAALTQGLGALQNETDDQSATPRQSVPTNPRALLHELLPETSRRRT